MSYHPAPQYRVTKTTERPFPWWRRTCEILVTSTLKEGQLSRVVDAALNILLKDALLSGSSLPSTEELSNPSSYPALHAKRLVNISAGPNLPLLSVSGRCTPLENDSGDADEAFEIILNTNFLEFAEDERIIFTLSSHIDAPDDITFSEINLLGRLLNIKPERFSLSLGFFRPTFISSSLGSVPEMLEGVEITATSREMNLRLWSDSLPRGKELPLSEQIGQDKCWLLKVEELLIVSLGQGVKL